MEDFVLEGKALLARKDFPGGGGGTSEGGIQSIWPATGSHAMNVRPTRGAVYAVSGEGRKRHAEERERERARARVGGHSIHFSDVSDTIHCSPASLTRCQPQQPGEPTDVKHCRSTAKARTQLCSLQLATAAANPDFINHQRRRLSLSPNS